MKQVKTFAITFVAALVMMLFLVSCNREPILTKREYKVVDTTSIARNGFNMVLGYDVIIKIDSSFYAGQLDSEGNLFEVNPRKLNLQK
jgi:hypothetical protein